MMIPETKKLTIFYLNVILRNWKMKIILRKRNSWLSNHYSKMEEEQIYEETLKDVMLNMRWYLDNIEKLPEYRVSWKNYRNMTATIPGKYVNKRKIYK